MTNGNSKSKLVYQNIYYMVAYCVEELKYFDESLIDYESLSGTHDLLAVLLCKSFEYLYRSGCLRQYNKKTIVTDKPRGKIDIQKSKQQGLYQQGKLICTITKLNMDTELNRIVKAAFYVLISSNSVIQDKINNKYLTLLDNYRLMLKEVSTIDINEEMLNKNRDIPEQYKPVMVVAKMILKDWLAYDSEGKHRLLELNDNERLCRIWEKYLRNLIKRNYSELEVTKPSYEFGKKRGRKNIKQPDMEIKCNKNRTVIVGDAKWYSSSTESSANECQIVAYSDKCAEKNKEYKIHGILFYASDETDEEPEWEDESDIYNIECYSYHINVNQDKEDMERDILRIVEKYI